ncbi:MAG: D-aminoacyl-tRNA deacylase [Candidatus Micrarchaeota archaeon]|nr:D-aminoacyl-tRNA deacylase [Candidatus Micrarchaeota archaeon]MCX8154282.1 D-aminoacyl-tRNA deacylase [Candidatus Micrarchaeota archaeon]
MRPILIYSSSNVASKTLADAIGDSIDMIDVNDSITHFTPPDTDRDYYIVLSSHSSKSGIPSATVHVPGNWGRADLGGRDSSLCYSYPSKMLQILKNYLPLRERGFEITYEVDHHGPYFNKPVMFVELGSDERYWRDVEAAKIVANAVLRAIDSNDEFDVYFGIDGTHYVPKINRYSLQNDIAFSHLLARYQQEGFRDEMFLQALQRTVENVDGIIVAKKSLDASQREYVRDFGNRYGVEVKFI